VVAAGENKTWNLKNWREFRPVFDEDVRATKAWVASFVVGVSKCLSDQSVLEPCGVAAGGGYIVCSGLAKDFSKAGGENLAPHRTRAILGNKRAAAHEKQRHSPWTWSALPARGCWSIVDADGTGDETGHAGSEK